MKLSTNKLIVDFHQSAKVGKKVYHMNDHRDNHAYRWYWNKYLNRLTNGKYYSFTPTRKNKRRLANILKNRKDIDYFL